MPPPITFSEALTLIKAGRHAYRLGWNGKNMLIGLQRPDENSKMQLPYLYIKTAKGELVPWVASQTDILKEDWVVPAE